MRVSNYVDERFQALSGAVKTRYHTALKSFAPHVDYLAENYSVWNTVEQELNGRGEQKYYPKRFVLFDGIGCPSSRSRAEMDIANFAIRLPPTLCGMVRVSASGLEGSGAKTECRLC